MPSTADLLADPVWLPDRFDYGKDKVEFARIDRDGLVRAPFLDERMGRWVTARASAPLTELSAPQKQAPARFIFHTAFCCSTLLARALDAPGVALSLKEPTITLDLCSARRAQERFLRNDVFLSTFRTLTGLLARPHLSDEAVVIKPTNMATPLIEPALMSGGPCLFLHGGLRDFLISLLKKGEGGRAWARKQFNVYRLDGGGIAAIPPRQAVSFTDLQVIALVWRWQQEQFAAALRNFPQARAASLDYRALLADPARALKAAARHLNLNHDEAQLDAVAAGEIFAVNSKFEGSAFDVGAREREEAATVERWREEIDLIEAWAAPISYGVDIGAGLPRPLVPAP